MFCGGRSKIKALLKENAELRQELELKSNELQAVRTQLKELQVQTTTAKEGQSKEEAFLGPFVEESVFYQVFANELIQDTLFSSLYMRGLKNLQLTSRRLNECVMGHLPTWRNRTIVIDAVDGDILAELDFEHSHLSWKSAKVNLVSWSEEIQRLERLWNQLEHLELTSNSYAEDDDEGFDESILPNFLSRCTQLVSLQVDQKLLWTCPVDSAPAVANALRKLNGLGLRGGLVHFDPETEWMTEFMVEELIKERWSMTEFYFDDLPDIAYDIMCTNVLSHLKYLSARGVDSLGTRDNPLSYPDMTKLRYLHVEAAPARGRGYGHLLNILKYKAPFLTVIKISIFSKKCPLKVLKALESHITLLESLDISAKYFETRREGIENPEDSIFSFLSNCIRLKHLELSVDSDGVRENKRSQPQPTTEEIVSKLPKNLNTLKLYKFPTAIRWNRHFDHTARKDLEDCSGVQLPKLKSYLIL